MPASVPTGWPKREESCGRGRETGHPPEAGGWCYNQRTAHREDATNGEADDMGAGCMTVNRNIDWKPISVKNGKGPIKTGMTKLGAFLGDGVVVGAGNTLQPGTVIAPGKTIPACYSVKQK